MTPGRYLPLLLTVTLFGALAAAQRTQALHLGYQLETLRADRALLSDQNRQLLCEISALSHPARIADKITHSEIALTDPVTLTENSGRLKNASVGDRSL